MGNGLLRWISHKESSYQCRRYGFDLWVRKTPWRRKWQPTPVLLLEKSHGQRNLIGHSPWVCKELNMTEELSTHAHKDGWNISQVDEWYLSNTNFKILRVKIWKDFFFSSINIFIYKTSLYVSCFWLSLKP